MKQPAFELGVLANEITQRGGSYEFKSPDVSNADLSNVWHLHFGSTASIEGFDFGRLKSFKNLEWLLINGQGTVNDNTVKQLLPLDTLRVLHIPSSQVSDIGVELISQGAPQLESLDISDTSITSLCVAPLLSLSFLEVLDISWNAMAESAVIKLLNNCVRLEELWVRGMSLPDLPNAFSKWKYEAEMGRYVTSA